MANSPADPSSGDVPFEPRTTPVQTATMLRPTPDYPPELWARIHGLFEKMIDAGDAAAILAAESDPAVAKAAERLYANHQQAQAQKFLDEPITLIRNLDPANAPTGASNDWDGKTLSHFRI